jgi:hypothetical protein
VLYQARRNSFGCDDPACGCEKHLTLTGLREPDSHLLPRIRHLVRLESMINVGCKFRPDDLTWEQWEELSVLSQERAWMDEKVREYDADLREKKSEVQQKIHEHRKKAGLPAPGKSIFGKR